MFGVSSEAWKNEQEMNILHYNQRYLILNEDGCCQKAGHNPKYLNYSLFDQNSKKILASSLTQLAEVDMVFHSNGKSIACKVARRGERKAVENKIVNH